MSAVSVGPFRDEPCAWVIEIDSMTVSKAQEIGKLLGSNGVTGRFMTGDMADNMKAFALLKVEHEKLKSELERGY